MAALVKTRIGVCETKLVVGIYNVSNLSSLLHLLNVVQQSINIRTNN